MSILQSSIPSYSCTQGRRGLLEPIAAVMGQSQGTPTQVCSSAQAHIERQTYTHLHSHTRLGEFKVFHWLWIVRGSSSTHKDTRRMCETATRLVQGKMNKPVAIIANVKIVKSKKKQMDE